LPAWCAGAAEDSVANTSSRPLTKRQRSELIGYLAPGVTLFRAVLFLCVVVALGWLLRAIQTRVVPLDSPLAHDAWWIVPTLAFATWLYLISKRWTGGHAFRRKVRSDLQRGTAAVHRISVVDAVEVHEQEDEGPTYFILTEEGRVMFFAGQYLDKYRRKGFPWRTFEIVETPDSRIFLDLEAAGEPVEPSSRREPLSWEETKRLGIVKAKYGTLEVDFASVKDPALRPL
jgi:hypothetical protein